MRILLATWVDPWTRSVSTVHHFVAAGRRLGHEVLVYGEPHEELPDLPYTLDLEGVDLALFVIQVPTDFPDMPHLARLLDGVPRERRVVVDLWGRYNDTIRLEHDFNHLEKVDGHLGWEWEEALDATSATILQPTFEPLRQNVGTYLFHGYEPRAVLRPAETADAAAARWRDAGADERPFGVMYVGSNWQRWEQVRRFLEGYADVRARVGRACLCGWHWNWRPDWAVENGIAGIDTDPEFLAALDVEIWDGVRYEYIVEMLGQARFAPVFHRPLFRHLGFVTARTFETFHADSLPVLMLPRDFVEAVYGPAALTLVPEGGVAAHLTAALDEPERFWQALLDTRAHLARRHSYERRVEELLEVAAAPAAARVAE
jgi:hypothetical protein